MAKVVSRVTKDAKLDKRTLSGKAASNNLGVQKTLEKKFTNQLGKKK